MNRGEVWRVETLSGGYMGVLVGNNSLTELYGRTQVVPVRPEAETLMTLVAVQLTSPIAGVAVVGDTAPVRVARLTERLGALSNEDMSRIEVALRAVFDLPLAG